MSNSTYLVLPETFTNVNLVGLASASTSSMLVARNGASLSLSRPFQLSSAPLESTSCPSRLVGVSCDRPLVTSPLLTVTSTVISRERSDEALKIVQRLHRDETDPDDVFAFREYQQMKTQYEIDRANSVSWKEMFTRPSYRKRIIIGAIVMFGSQTTGTTVIANYGPELYSALGYGTTKQLLFSGCYATLALCGNFFNAFTIDYIGRVNALKIGWCGDAIALIGECVSLSTFERTGSHSSAIASVFFLFLHIALFAFNIDVTTYVYTSEIFPNHIRAKGMSASIVAYFASLLIYLEVAPTGKSCYSSLAL